jgi:8-oxo-dGTP pyrophosphatase MutT (NUDIX family)
VIVTEERWNALPKKIMAAGALLFDEARRILLVKPTYRLRWQLPGGVVDTGESPKEACEREILEELGCRLTVVRPVLVDYTRTVGEMVVDHFEWLFQGPSLSREQVERIQIDGKEIEEYRCVSMAEMPVMVEVFNERRIRNAISAIERGTFVYTDDNAVKPYPA